MPSHTPDSNLLQPQYDADKDATDYHFRAIKAGAGDEAVRRELAYVDTLLQSNDSAELSYARVPFSTQADFVELYIVDAVEEGTDDDVLDLENPEGGLQGRRVAVRGRDRICG
ncbi:hypothetical protein BC827DRAFT_1266779 [Russula dissimulans]|nr:hypothetical protein BC827DRAFT_1266779 [Russula dissimulans]